MSNRKPKNHARMASRSQHRATLTGRSVRQVSGRMIERGEQLPPDIGIIPGTATPERLNALFKSWRNDNAEEQRETLEYLKRALDKDRLSNRPLFPKRNTT